MSAAAFPMTAAAPSGPAAHPALPTEWRDFFALTKPRVMTLVVFTGLCGMLAAPVPMASPAPAPRARSTARWTRSAAIPIRAA